MSEIKRFQVGERMSQAVVHGDTVYTAGQVAQSAPGASVADRPVPFYHKSMICSGKRAATNPG